MDEEYYTQQDNGLRQPLLLDEETEKDWEKDDRTAELLRQAGRSLEESQAQQLMHRQSNIAIIGEDTKCCVILTPVRRMFCLLAFFDFMLIFLMWIIYVQLTGQPFTAAFSFEVKYYEFKTSMFDFVLSGFVRSVLLIIIYAGIRTNKWYMVAFTTTASTVLAITKVFVSGGDIFKQGQPLSYLIVIATFILCWSELWHFDFQVIPSELRTRICSLTTSLPTVAGDGSFLRQQRLHGPSGQQMAMARSNYQSFYTPYTRTYRGSTPSTLSGSLSDLSEDAQEARTRDKMYIKEAKDTMRQTLRMFHINEGWKMEREEADGVVIKSRQFDNIGKVYRGETTFDCSSKVMYKLMWQDVDNQPAWNPTVAECQVIHKINKQTDILYVVANDAAGGLISSRDFITLRRSKRKGSFYVCSGMATKFDLVPEKKNMVRGENGPGGYIMGSLAEDPNQCQFTWLLNTNLKGWIPQTLIDQSMTSVVADSIKALRQHVSTLPR